MDRRVEIILELLELDRSSSGGRLAKRVNLSSSRFHSLFKGEMKTTPARYAKDENMKVASGLLKTTLLSVKVIAVEAGFNDQSHFVRDFKRSYGLTPTKYRQRNFKD